MKRSGADACKMLLDTRAVSSHDATAGRLAPTGPPCCSWCAEVVGPRKLPVSCPDSPPVFYVSAVQGRRQGGRGDGAVVRLAEAAVAFRKLLQSQLRFWGCSSGLFGERGPAAGFEGGVACWREHRGGGCQRLSKSEGSLHVFRSTNSAWSRGHAICGMHPFAGPMKKAWDLSSVCCCTLVVDDDRSEDDDGGISSEERQKP